MYSVDPKPLYLYPQATSMDVFQCHRIRRNLRNVFRAIDSGRSKFAGIQAFEGPAPPCRYRRLFQACMTSYWHVGMTSWIVTVFLKSSEMRRSPLARCSNGVKTRKILFSVATRSPEQQTPFQRCQYLRHTVTCVDRVSSWRCRQNYLYCTFHLSLNSSLI